MNKTRLNYCETKVYEQLLPTWQPVAAIAIRCDIPVKTALSILFRMESRGIVKKVRCRIDGHNRTYVFKKLEYLRVLGVYTTIENDYENEDC